MFFQISLFTRFKKHPLFKFVIQAPLISECIGIYSRRKANWPLEQIIFLMETFRSSNKNTRSNIVHELYPQEGGSREVQAGYNQIISSRTQNNLAACVADCCVVKKNCQWPLF